MDDWEAEKAEWEREDRTCGACHFQIQVWEYGYPYFWEEGAPRTELTLQGVGMRCEMDVWWEDCQGMLFQARIGERRRISDVP